MIVPSASSEPNLSEAINNHAMTRNVQLDHMPNMLKMALQILFKDVLYVRLAPNQKVQMQLNVIHLVAQMITK